MRTREQIEEDADKARMVHMTMGTHLLLEVLLDIREQNAKIESRLADAQANRNRFHVDSHPS